MRKNKIFIFIFFLIAIFTIVYIPSILACPHSATEINIVVPASCTTDGQEDVVCAECDAVLKSHIIHPVGHSFTEWKEVTKASSLANGIEVRECTRCSFKEEREIPYVFISSSPDITLSYEYFATDKFMPYGLITPSSAKNNDKTPLIVSLHGMGELGCNESKFSNRFVVKAMRNWELEGFNAYVLFPHLSGNGYSNSWNGPVPAENVFKLIDYIIEEYNIDTNKIVIQGHSLGGYGCLYMATYKPDYFSAVVPISPYSSNVDLSKLENMEFKCFVGKSSRGEDENSVRYTMNVLKPIFGEENIIQRSASHNKILTVAFTEDANGDNKSDLIEWMLSQTKK